MQAGGTAMDIPFPVHPDSQPRPDLVKLATHEPLLVEDAHWARWISHKRVLLAQSKVPIVVPAMDGGQFETMAGLVSARFRVVLPSGPIDQQGGFPWLGGICPNSALEFFQALTLSLQEDFALMVPDQDGRLVANLLSVCFPSGWNPADKLGRTLMSIHAPVADNQALQRASASMERAMLNKGPFVRYVWTISGNDRLSRAPGEDTLQQAQSLDQLWFRCERQITMPLEGKACLFLIRVFVAPYREVVNSASRQARMVQACRAMSPSMVQYKNISRAVDLILKTTNV
jgi:hypothetical protein